MDVVRVTAQGPDERARLGVPELRSFVAASGRAESLGSAGDASVGVVGNVDGGHGRRLNGALEL